MGVGEIAGLIAAIAFAILAGFMIYPLIRLGKPVIKIASAVYALKSTAQSFMNNRTADRAQNKGE